jgi:hypothetical protein
MREFNFDTDSQPQDPISPSASTERAKAWVAQVLECCYYRPLTAHSRLEHRMIAEIPAESALAKSR